MEMFLSPHTPKWSVGWVYIPPSSKLAIRNDAEIWHTHQTYLVHTRHLPIVA